jgi:GntR family transcriptional regulator
VAAVEREEGPMGEENADGAAGGGGGGVRQRSGRGETFRPEALALNRRLPLWYQVSQSLRASILGRPPTAPLRLPIEEELAGHYGVSVPTMRQALKCLEEEGLITRQRRHGTFIEPGARQAARVRLLGSVDTIVAQQSGMRAALLGHGPEPVPPELAEHFGADVPVTAFRRLRYDDEGVPTNWAVNHVRSELAERIDPADLERWPMTRVLRDRLGLRIGRNTETVEARLADPRTAELLGVPLLSPILHYTGVTYDEGGRAVDVARIHYRGDRFAFSVTVDAR